MSIRPLAAPFNRGFVSPMTPPPAMPMTVPGVAGQRGLRGHVLTTHTLLRRYESLAENIAEAAQHPNAEANQQATLITLQQLGLITAEERVLRAESLRQRDRQHSPERHGTGHAGLGVANTLWKIIHPARLCWSAAWDRWAMHGSPDAYLKLHQRLREHAAPPEFISFHTDDNVQLAGMVIRADSGTKRRPMMLMVSGNAACAEGEFDVAMAHARQFDVDVMLYNPRGVGLSLGDVTHPGQALLDCAAAVRKAAEYSDRLCVWGCSLGGALTTQVLRTLRETNDPVLGKLEFTVCINSFPSLPSIMGHMVMPRWIPKSWGRGASARTLSMMGIDPLETCRALRQHGVGVPTLVCNSTQDEMMHGPSNLAEALQAHDEKLPHDLQVVQCNAGSHNAYFTYLDEPAYVNALARWRGL